MKDRDKNSSRLTAEQLKKETVELRLTNVPIEVWKKMKRIAIEKNTSARAVVIHAMKTY